MKFPILFVIALLSIDLALAQNISLDVVLPDEVTLGLTYTSLFKITNLDHMKGVDSFVNVTVAYNITKNGLPYSESNFTKTVNAYTSSGTGSFFVSELGNYLVCGISGGTSVCKEVRTLNPIDIHCNVNVSVILNKQVYQNNERVEIRNVLSGADDFPFVLEYWVEDLYGNFVKNPLNTSNLNEKSFTPDISEKDGVFFAKNRLVFVGCGNAQFMPESQALFVVKNQDYSIPVLQSKSSSGNQADVKNESSYAGKIVSFYTRTKNYHETINIYANVKANDVLSVLFNGNGEEDWRTVYSSEKLVFEAKAKPGDNYFELSLFDSEGLIDKKSLIVNLKGDVKLKENKSAIAIVDKESNSSLKKSSTNSRITVNSSAKKDLEKENITHLENLLSRQEANLTIEVNQTKDSEYNAVSGNLIYASPKVKTQNSVHFFLLAIILLAGISLVKFKCKSCLIKIFKK